MNNTNVYRSNPVRKNAKRIEVMARVPYGARVFYSLRKGFYVKKKDVDPDKRRLTPEE
jgi:hypothetical protein